MEEIKKNNKMQQFHSSSKKKKSVARVYLRKGVGKIVVNKKNASDYFYMDSFAVGEIIKPLKIFNLENDYDIFIRVNGGGISSQVESIRIGVSKSLLSSNSSYKELLNSSSMLNRIRDRGKERKKIGKKKARKSPQWRKR